MKNGVRGLLLVLVLCSCGIKKPTDTEDVVTEVFSSEQMNDVKAGELSVVLLDRKEDHDRYLRIVNQSDKIYGESIAYYETKEDNIWLTISECPKWFASEFDSFSNYVKSEKTTISSTEGQETVTNSATELKTDTVYVNDNPAIELNVDRVYGVTLPNTEDQNNLTRLRLIFELYGTSNQPPYKEETTFIIPLN